MRTSNYFPWVVPNEAGSHDFFVVLVLLQTNSEMIYKQENNSTKVESSF